MQEAITNSIIIAIAVGVVLYIALLFYILKTRIRFLFIC